MIEAARDERMIKSALKSFANAYGFERFAYLQTEGAEVRAFNSYPEEWQDIYLGNQYSRIDPVVTEASVAWNFFPGRPTIGRLVEPPNSGAFGTRRSITAFAVG
jgi:LuxR family transcriptional activator of conjugal transfer of Ti plasmids